MVHRFPIPISIFLCTVNPSGIPPPTPLVLFFAMMDLIGSAGVVLTYFSFVVHPLIDDGAVYTWGRGDDGRLGHGDNGWKYVPRVVEALEGQRIVQARRLLLSSRMRL